MIRLPVTGWLSGTALLRYPVAFRAARWEGCTVDPRQLRKLAEQSANFGFLLPYPLLLFYGAGAEALV